MYKYFYDGDIHTAQDFYEARIKTGIRFPHPFHSFSHYVVRIWQWDPSDGDYTVEVLSEPGHRTFNRYEEALQCFRNLAADLPAMIMEDVKLELVQDHLGSTYSLKSKMVFAPFFVGEC